MAQVKIYGHASFLTWVKDAMSEAIHECTMSVLGLPPEKRFHRFIPLKEDWFYHLRDRSERYVILEILLAAGRTVKTRREYIRALIERIERECGIPRQDIEITLVETPRENWGGAE